MVIAKALPSDLETLRSFAERTFRIAFEADNEPVRFEEYCSKAFSSEQFRLELEHAASSFWLGWEGETLAAYLKLNFDRHPPELASNKTVQVERLYVEPAMQGRKIGAQVLDFACEQAIEMDADWIWLSVWQDNPPALRFYERYGFEIFGTKTFWLGDEAQTDWLVKKKVSR
ncbi:MAG: GNAT family N-acetyltransferase [Phycisphaerae bacterium]|nr:GNAT family N-acetyltransferase [Saprospiraceae bacterium]